MATEPTTTTPADVTPVQFVNTILDTGEGEFLEVRCFGPGEAVHRSFYRLPISDLPELPPNADGYFGVAPRIRREGTADAVKSVTSLWLDVDAKCFSEGKAGALAALDRLADLRLRPSVVVDSGHGFHPYWLLKEPLDVPAAQEIMGRLRAAVHPDLDNVADAPRVLRLPGTFNHKDDPPLPVVVVGWEPDRRFNPDDFAALPEPAEPEPKPKPKAADGGHVFGEGHRHPACKDRIVYLRKKTIRGAELRGAILAWGAERCNPPLGEGEVDDLLRWAETNVGDDEPLRASPVVVCLADVPPVPVEWLWPGWLPRSTVVLLSGVGGLGKSTIALDFSARISRGWSWPDGSDGGAPGNVLILSAEDGAACTIRPRLDAAGADVSRVHLMQAVLQPRSKGEPVEMLPSIVDGLSAVEDAIEKIGEVDALVIDPLMAYMGSTDTHRDGAIRSALAPLQALAERARACVLCIVHHRKGGGSAAERVGGSVALVNLARSAITVLPADDHDPEKRLLLSHKSNLSPTPDGLAFRLHQRPDATVASTEWLEDRITRSADEILAAREEPKDSATTAAAKWLRELLLVPGTMPVKEIKTAAKEAGLAWRTVQRARDAEGIVTDKLHFTGGWRWRLPDVPPADDGGEDDA